MKISEDLSMICNTETGVCEIPEDNAASIPVNDKELVMIYFTDPICSTCWGVEPQLKKLKAEYGQYFNIEYRMGGLLKSWAEYGGKDVRNPAEVGKHWEEAGALYKMPIDGDLWQEDPMDSSYPPSIAFKAVQLQDQDKAVLFLRRIREMVFLEKKNIYSEANLMQAAIELGVNMDQFRADLKDRAQKAFEEDLQLKQSMGVKGFPTIYFRNQNEDQVRVYGFKPYADYETALLKLIPDAVKITPPGSWEEAFKLFNSFTTTEFAVFFDIGTGEAESILAELESTGWISKFSSKNGMLWKSNSKSL